MRTFKISCIVVLLALAAVFIYQNTAVLQLNFLFWSVSMSACLMLLIALFTGIIIGLLAFTSDCAPEEPEKVQRKGVYNRFSKLFLRKG